MEREPKFFEDLFPKLVQPRLRHYSQSHFACGQMSFDVQDDQALTEKEALDLARFHVLNVNKGWVNTPKGQINEEMTFEEVQKLPW